MNCQSGVGALGMGLLNLSDSDDEHNNERQLSRVKSMGMATAPASKTAAPVDFSRLLRRQRTK